MRRWLEYAGFGALAVAAHVALFAARPQSGADAGGVGGDTLVSIQAAPATVVEMVETWEQTVQVVQEAPTLLAPDAPDAPPVVLNPIRLATAPNAAIQVAMPEITPPDLPDMDTATAAPIPDVELTQPSDVLPLNVPQPARPQARPSPVEPMQLALVQPAQPQQIDVDTAPPPPPPPPKAQPKPKPKPKPKAQPKPKPKAQKTPKKAVKSNQTSAGRAKQRAAGSGGSSQAGKSGKSKVSTASKGQQAKLKAVWGSRIRSKIERNIRHPRGTTASGKVTLSLTVGRDGRLRGVSVRRSSGVAALDQAAVAAVKRAGRFPSAPKKLPGISFPFSLPIIMKR